MIAHAKVQRRHVGGLCIEISQIRLVVLRKNVERRGVGAVELQFPAALVKIAQRYAGIVLHDRPALREQQVADRGKLVLVHEVGGGFHIGDVGMGLCQVIQERTPPVEAAVAEVGGKINERPLDHGLWRKEMNLGNGGIGGDRRDAVHQAGKHHAHDQGGSPAWGSS